VGQGFLRPPAPLGAGGTKELAEKAIISTLTDQNPSTGTSLTASFVHLLSVVGLRVAAFIDGSSRWIAPHPPAVPIRWIAGSTSLLDRTCASTPSGLESEKMGTVTYIVVRSGSADEIDHGAPQCR
jgi:hypothetical protein